MKRISNKFPILQEARREVLEDLMDSPHAKELINNVVDGNVKVVEVDTQTPSPFAFSLIASGYSDVIKVEDKQAFLRRMHQEVLARISLKEGKKKLKNERTFSYTDFWEDAHKKQEDQKDAKKEKLKIQLWGLKHVPIYIKEELVKLIEFGSCRQDVLLECKKYRTEIEKNWPEELKEFMLKKLKS